MSRSIDLFIDSQRPIEEVAAEISRLAQIELEPDANGASWLVHEGTVRAALRRHPGPQGGDAVLPYFGYALSAQVDDEIRLVDAPETTFLRLVSETLRHGGVGTLLVHDLQYRDRSASPATAPADPDSAQSSSQPAG